MARDAAARQDRTQNQYEEDCANNFDDQHGPGPTPKGPDASARLGKHR